ncbi:MAG: ABC transporter permease [Oscillospiraceae bacterium]|nr:ABC transporter permease [Oscillospiraceae bacterium]
MSFAEIAVKNVQKRLGSYLAYFLSTAFSVVVFHLFCTMYYNPAFAVYRFGSGKMNTLFQGAAVAVLLFATIFVLYSGSFFLRGRKKEIAIYSLLGMAKRAIALLLFCETFVIGMAAVVFGIAIGSITAQYFSSGLMRVMAVGTSVTYTVSPMAAVVTTAAFAVLFIISGIRAYQVIYRYRLIDLLSATHQSEGIPKYSVVGAAAAIVFVAAGYLAACAMNLNQAGMKLLLPAFLVVVLVSLGTYLLFRNAVPMATARLKRKTSFYYQTSTFISTSQIAFRLKANAKMLTLSALLCALSITMVSASYSLYRGLEQSADFYAPFSYLVKNISEEQHTRISQTVSDIGEVRITAEDTIPLIHTQLQNDTYGVQNGVEEDATLGAPVDGYILSDSIYQKIIADTQAAYGKGSSLRTDYSGKLADQECYFLDGNMTNRYSAGLIGQELTFRVGNSTGTLQVSGISLHKYLGLLDLYQCPSIVVSDTVYQQYMLAAGSENIDTFYGFMFDDEMASAHTTAALDGFIPARFSDSTLPSNLSYIGMYQANFALYGSYVFIGLFLGILFLLSMGSVIYYKMIMEAQEESLRYAILRKVGMKKQEMHACVAKQLGVVFGTPLAVGLLHTIFALATYNRMMELMGQEMPTFANALMVAGLSVLIYGVFYLISVKKYCAIVWKKTK